MAKEVKKSAVKPAKKTVKKADKSEKPAAKKSAASKKDASQVGIRKTEAAVRSVQEEGSIAPPSKNLVSAFSLFKTSKRPTSSSGPTVARLAAGAPVQPRPVVKPVEIPAAKPSVPAPTTSAAAPAVPVKPATTSTTPTSPVTPGTAAAPSAAPAPTPARPQAQPVSPRTLPPYVPPPQRHSPGQRPPHRPTHKPAGKAALVKQPQAPGSVAPTTSASPSSSGAPAPKPALKPLEVSSMVTVRELAEKMEIKSNDVIKKLMGLGIFATINQRLEQEAAAIVAQDFGFDLKVIAMYKEEEIEIAKASKDEPEKLKTRPPVVTIMGHVDHGKTSLLDAIRESRITEGEAGGITQHIGAYQVKTARGLVTFLDTPGHEAFTAMRARGAKVTDLVILVVSAVDGIMPQTLEAIDHAKAAGVPIIVAVNKIDLPGANPQKIRQDLAAIGLQPEEWGGKTIFQDISAKKRINLDKLLEMVAIQAEVLELKANPDRPGYGVVLEARLDPRRGSVASLLIQAGTVKIGDSFVAGLCHGRIKALVDDGGRRLESAGPSRPVEMLGLTGAPQAGDIFSVVADDRQAREIAQKRQLIAREQELAHQRHMTLVGLKGQLGGKAKDLNIVLKADVQGSLQALRDSLESLSNPECRVRTIHAGVGNLNESDVLLASASDAVILLFHTAAESRAEELAQREGVEMRRYDIIYDLIGDVRAALEGLLEPEIVEVIIGKGEVRQIFDVKKGGKVAGCYVRDGKAAREGSARVMRDNAVAASGKLTSLKRFKDDAKEVEKGLECGIQIDGFSDYRIGDQIEFIVKESRTRRLAAPAK